MKSINEKLLHLVKKNYNQFYLLFEQKIQIRPKLVVIKAAINVPT